MSVINDGQRKLALAVCEALGLPAKDTRRIEIVLEAGEVAIVTAEMRLTASDKLVQAIAEFELVPKGSAAPTAAVSGDVTTLLDKARVYVAEPPLPSRNGR